MLGFNEETYERVLEGAVKQIAEIDKAVDEISNKGFDNLYLVGSGGTYATIGSLAYMLKENSALTVNHEIAAEVVRIKPKTLTSKSVLVTASLSGTTEETIDAVKYANSVGATTIGFTGDADTPFGKELDYCFASEASNDDLVENLEIQFFALGARFMKDNGEFPEYESLITTLEAMPEVLLQVRKDADERSAQWAKDHKDTKFHMFVGAGNTYWQAYEYAMCVLEEMQWVATKSINAAEFFHGTIEMTDKDMSFVLLKGEDSTRPLVDRVEKFVKQHSNYVTIFDSKDFELKGVAPEMRKFIAPTVISAALERISTYMEKETGHSLDIRRYYRKVEY
jgi:fructoselysine-6-phosphate deglycase